MRWSAHQDASAATQSASKFHLNHKIEDIYQRFMCDANSRPQGGTWLCGTKYFQIRLAYGLDAATGQNAGSPAG